MTATHRWRGREFQQAFETSVKESLAAAAVILQTEIKLQLNKGGPGPPSPPGQPPHKQQGTLGRSIQIDVSELNKFVVKVGPDLRLAPYARIQELGGVIVPKKVRLLAVPLNDRARKLTRGLRSVRQLKGLTFIKRKKGPPILAIVREDRVIPMFVLVPRVTLPARPYIRPAVKLARPRILELLSPKAILSRIKLSGG